MVNTCLYIIGGINKPYKIGITKDINQRLKTLQTGYPFELIIHHKIEMSSEKARLVESEVHKMLRHKQSHGEWFNEELENLKLDIQYILIKTLKD